jgi:hypothetical protein
MNKIPEYLRSNSHKKVVRQEIEIEIRDSSLEKFLVTTLTTVLP